MGRAILAVVVGYLTMFVLVFVTFSAAYLGMGPDRAFQPGTYEISGLWAAVSIVLGFLAALAGGFVCTAIGRRRMPPRALTALVLGLGLAMGIPAAIAAQSAETKDRPAEVSNLDAMKDARQPGWIALLNPLIGAAGVMAGARLRGLPPV